MKEPIGHDVIRSQLRAMAPSNANPTPLAHAWLFAGPTGVGKFAIARWWAAVLKCPEGGNCQPVCESCRLVAGGVHPDVFETGPAPKDKSAVQSVDVEIERKKSVGIEESRALIQRLSLRPTRPGPRIAIVREAGSMTVPAQNALLKLLEEPPGSAVIILVTDNVGAMIVTVRSRCRHLAFGTLSQGEVHRVLLAQGWTDDEALAAAACARGSVARALTMSSEGLVEREQLLLAWEGLRRSPDDVEGLIAALVARKSQGYGLGDLLEWQLAKVEASLGREVAEPSAELTRILGEARSLATPPQIANAERIRRTMGEIARNVNARLAIRDLLINVRV